MSIAGFQRSLFHASRGAVLGLLTFLFLPAIVQGQVIAEPAQNAVAGSRVFGDKGCVECHSVRGLGGRGGPDLAEVEARHSFNQLAATMWNHVPRMAARMRERGTAPARVLPRDAANLFAFLYTLDYFDPPGDPREGRTLFFDKQCVLCHQVGGVGGVVGPTLDFLGGYRSPIPVAAAMWNHGPAMAEEMRARGVTRPTFTGRQLRDLIAYLESTSGVQPDESTYVLPGRAAAGRDLFAAKGCAGCHGLTGRGGVGPALAGRGSPEGLIDFAAAMWNKAPAMTREMGTRGVAVPNLTASEMADIVAYLYAVGYFPGSGSADRGRLLLGEKGCTGCHGGQGGAPVLDPARYSTGMQVFAALINHVAHPGVEDRDWPLLNGADVGHLVSYLVSPPR
jgi:mono/diheme cytochrome c family protein